MTTFTATLRELLTERAETKRYSADYASYSRSIENQLLRHANEIVDLCEAVEAWSTQASLKSKHTVAEKELFAALARLEGKHES